MLKDISLYPNGTTPAMIVKAEVLSRPSNSNRNYTKIIAKGWIFIKHNPKDKRSHLIFLTNETKALIQEIEHVSDEVIKVQKVSIPKEEIENTVRVLQSMIRNLQKVKGD